MTDRLPAALRDLREAPRFTHPPVLYSVSAVLDGVEFIDEHYHCATLDRLLVAFFHTTPEHRRDDLSAFLHPDCAMGHPPGDLMAGVWTTSEADQLEAFLGQALERHILRPPFLFTLPLRLTHAGGGRFIHLLEGDPPFGVAYLAEAGSGIDRETGKRYVRAWHPSDGGIVGSG